jgi:hypothetical protein
MPGHWPEPMPWYFRTRVSWLAELERAGWSVSEAREVAHPERGEGLSMIFIASLC